jgi:glycosyltransferase involved in cell wall biosynthesis
MNVTFVPWYPSNPYQEQLTKNLERLGVPVSLVAARAFSRPGAAIGLRCDVLHLHWLQAFVVGRNVAAAWIKCAVFIAHLIYLRVRGVKLVWTIHELRDHERQNPALDRLCSKVVSRLCHAAIVHCNPAKDAAMTALRLRGERISIVPHGNYIDWYPNRVGRAEARRSLGIPEGALVFLFMGIIKPYKGVLELVEAFSRIPRGDVVLVITGKPYREDLARDLHARTEGQPNIRFFPEFTPDEKVQLYMNACDCTVFPYRDILTSGSVLLSMTFGRACIAPRIGCLTEDLDGEGGFLYDPGARDALHRTLLEAIERREDLPAMGRHNRARAERAAWLGIAEKTLAVYASCVSKHHQRQARGSATREVR